jgi:hypothetical protein
MVYTRSISQCSTSCSNLAYLSRQNPLKRRQLALETIWKASKTVSVDETA